MQISANKPTTVYTSVSCTVALCCSE